MKNIKLIGATRLEKIMGGIACLLLVAFLVRSLYQSQYMQTWEQKKDSLQTQLELYQRYTALYSQRENVEKTYKANLKNIEAIEDKIFTGNDINITSAKLQKVIQTLSTENNIAIQRTQTEKPVQVSDGLYVINLALFGQSDSMRDLNNFLATIENFGNKFLYNPKLYLKKTANSINFEMQIFGIAMLDHAKNGQE